jgi:hypothetical protein
MSNSRNEPMLLFISRIRESLPGFAAEAYFFAPKFAGEQLAFFCVFCS